MTTTPVPSHLSRPKYRPDIDGLRAVAVMAVVAFHAFPTWIKGGFIGVDVFFVISGFLISIIIFENLDKGTFRFTEFYARRVRRIFPALSIVLFACLVFGWVILLADEFTQLGKHIAAGAGFVSNLVLWSEAGYFDNSADTKPLLHLWSLGIEEQFYIIWPLLLWFSWKHKFNPLILTFLVAFVSFALNIKGIKEDPIATFYSPLTRLWELLCGALLAWFSLYKSKSFSFILNWIDRGLSSLTCSDKKRKNGKTLTNLLSLCGFFMLLYGFWRINRELSFPGYWPMVPVMGTVLIISSGPMAWVNRIILSSKVAVWLGLISFPLYLWHWPILSFGRIIYDETPPVEFKLLAVALSISLSNLTVKFIERPFRFNNQRNGLNIASLSGLVFMLGAVGFFVSQADSSQSHEYETLTTESARDHVIGSSAKWYRGKEDWLYLGNAYDKTVAKLKLSKVPTESQLEATKEMFSKVATAGSQFNTKVVLIVAPNKSSIYPEYLPNELVPSTERYISLFLDKLEKVQNLTVYDPTDDLLRLKKSEGFLYFMTDTHWNNKGAFLTYSGFSKLLNLTVPQIEFRHGSTYSGDLIDISKLKDFPLHAEDNWSVVWKNKPIWVEREVQNEQKTSIGFVATVTNRKPLSNEYIWVVGDSFSGALRQYFNATFKEVRYVGHWAHKLNDLPSELVKADKKPDMIVVIRVERSF